MQAAQIVHDDGPEPRRVKVKERLTNYFQIIDFHNIRYKNIHIEDIVLYGVIFFMC